MLNVKAKAADRSKNRKHVNSINLFVVVRGFASAQRANDELIEGLADAHPSSPINHGIFPPPRHHDRPSRVVQKDVAARISIAVRTTFLSASRKCGD